MAKRGRTVKVTWAEAVRDVLIRSMDKGQGPLYLLGVIVAIILVRMPTEDVGLLARRVVDLLVEGRLLGWILFGLTLGAWSIHAAVQRRVSFTEQDRMAAEKTKLQTDKIGGAVKSSKQK